MKLALVQSAYGEMIKLAKHIVAMNFVLTIKYEY